MGNDQIISGFDDEACDYLTIRLQRVEGMNHCLVIDLKGSIDAYNCTFLRRGLMRAVEAGFVQFVILLPRVDYISSTGVGTFLAVARTLIERCGSVTIVEPQPKVMEIFKIMHLHTFFTCVSSVDEALISLSGSTPTRVFPRKLRCPICDTTLRAEKPGRFRCSHCKSALVVDGAGRACL